MNTQDYFLQIEEYYEGSLSGDEKNAFEAELKKNKSLAEAVKNFPLAKDIAGGILELELENELNTLKKESEGRSAIPLTLNRKLIAAAIGIIMIGFVGYSFYYASSNYSDKILMAEFYTDIPINTNLSGDDVNKISLDNAEVLYNRNRFAESMEMLNELRKTLTGDQLTKAKTLEAHCQFKLENYNAVVEILTSLDGHEDQLTLALAYIGLKNYDKAVEILDSEPNDKNFSQLGDKIRSPWRRLTL